VTKEAIAAGFPKIRVNGSGIFRSLQSSCCPWLEITDSDKNASPCISQLHCYVTCLDDCKLIVTIWMKQKHELIFIERKAGGRGQVMKGSPVLSLQS
jgi:hypothetical protein